MTSATHSIGFADWPGAEGPGVCKRSSMVECGLPKADVEGSSPFACSGVRPGMICRHGPNDPSCSSHRDYVDPTPSPRYSAPVSYGTVTTPDSKNYTIEEAVRIGAHLVLKVKYPNCQRCAYEGNKVMVFLNVSEVQVLKWKEIDPHFRNIAAAASQAPSPAARFPASKEGWTDALTYARAKASV